MVKKACTSHSEYRETCFGCRKATERANAARTAAVAAVIAPSGPGVYKPDPQGGGPGQFQIECVCGERIATRYLTGTCTCGRVWKIEWDEAAKEYHKKARTRTKTVAEQMEKEPR